MLASVQTSSQGNQSQLDLVTDSLLDIRKDRVFPVLSDEAGVLAPLVAAIARPGSRVLDVGTGSGILGITAALAGAGTVLSDINSKAVLYSQNNARLHGVHDRIQFYLSDVLTNIPETEFDLVVCNPPFAPLPPNCPFHLSGDGGPIGFRVILPLLLSVNRYLARNGIFLLLSLSPVVQGKPLVLEVARQLLSCDRIFALRVYQDLISLSDYGSIFAHLDTTGPWYRDLRRRGIHGLSYVLLVGCPENLYRPITDIACSSLHMDPTTFGGSWNSRLFRYSTWLSTMQ